MMPIYKNVDRSSDTTTKKKKKNTYEIAFLQKKEEKKGRVGQTCVEYNSAFLLEIRKDIFVGVFHFSSVSESCV